MVHITQIVVLVVRIDAQTHSTRSRACSSAKSVVRNVCVCPLEPMATRRYAPATTTGRPKGEDPNALRIFQLSQSHLNIPCTISHVWLCSFSFFLS